MCGGESDDAAQVCSINGSGIIFLCGKKFPVSSELVITVQACTLRPEQKWNISGLVVECRNVKRGRHARYQVTLLFSDLPDGLKNILTGETPAARSFIPLQNCPLFGLN